MRPVSVDVPMQHVPHVLLVSKRRLPPMRRARRHRRNSRYHVYTREYPSRTSKTTLSARHATAPGAAAPQSTCNFKRYILWHTGHCMCSASSLTMHLRDACVRPLRNLEQTAKADVPVAEDMAAYSGGRVVARVLAAAPTVPRGGRGALCRRRDRGGRRVRQP